MAHSVVHVLQEDPGLAAALDPREFAVASQHLVAAELRLPRGPWEPGGPLGSHAADLGLLLLEGFLVRETSVGRHTSAELLGAGDVLRPWDHSHEGDDEAPVTLQCAWRVLEPARLAVLDARFSALAGRLPTVTAELMSRSLRRSRLLGLLRSLSAMPRLDARLLTLLWHLADRWGSVGPDGTLVPVPLTHATLAQLVAAQRPSVTSALRTLERCRAVHRVEDGWLLLGDPPADLEQPLADGQPRFVSR